MKDHVSDTAAIRPAKKYVLSLGGWLSILNAALWVLLSNLVYEDLITDSVAIMIGLFLSLPVALPFTLPKLDHQLTIEDGEIACIAIGVNTFVWGYGLAWMWRILICRCSLWRLMTVVTVIAVLLGIIRAVMD